MRNVVSRGRFSFTLPPASGPLEPEPPTIEVAPAPPVTNRRMRRKQKVFVQRLARRLQDEGTPAQVETLPDGGINVRIDTREKS